MQLRDASEVRITVLDNGATLNILPIAVELREGSSQSYQFRVSSTLTEIQLLLLFWMPVVRQ